jgi:hypothetical protein
MTGRRARAAAWSALTLALLLAGGALLLGTLTVSHGVPDDVNLGGLIGIVLALPFLAVGPLVVARRPDNAIGWLFCAMALLFTFNAFAACWGAYSLYGGGGLPAPRIAVWASSALQVVPLFVGPLYLFLLFPDGKLLSRRWRPAGWGIAILSVVGILSTGLRPGRLDGGISIDNPVAIEGAVGRFLGSLDPALTAGVAILFVASIVSLVLRFRRSHGLERQQLKWVVYTASIAVGAFTLAFAVGPIAAFVFPIGIVAVAAMPLAAGMAILRYRLYEIDRVINRTLVYALMTATLAAAYLGSVLLLQLALDPVTSGSSLAVALSTLAVAALFRPARGRIQGWVDRRFYRRRYDATRTLEDFSARLREQVDLDSLAGELRAVVTDTMQPAHVSLWLREAAQ